MTNCYDEGRLRAYLDGELPALERAPIAAHLASCAACRDALERLKRAAAFASVRLSASDAGPDARASLARLSQHVHAFEHSNIQRSKPMQSTSFWSGRRNMLAALAAVVAVLSLLVLPPVRAAADQLLSIFRVQKVVFVPVDPERVRQLQDLNIDGQALFVGKPINSGQESPRKVGSAAEAASLVGYAIAEPQLRTPALSSEYTVVGPGRSQFQVNVETARQVLTGLGVTDVEIPDALGAGPITVEVPAFVSARYRGANYDLTLNQGTSPKVTLPDGVDLAQLGTAALRVLGMTSEQAEVAAGDIDWSSTLLFPFPADTNNIRQVSVGDENGLLVEAGGRDNSHWQLYWQSDNTFYMLGGRGSMGDEDMIDLLITTAESVR
jgi:hypothetical protein